jgi:hypothetical protein
MARHKAGLQVEVVDTDDGDGLPAAEDFFSRGWSGCRECALALFGVSPRLVRMVERWFHRYFPTVWLEHFTELFCHSKYAELQPVANIAHLGMPEIVAA